MCFLCCYEYNTAGTRLSTIDSGRSGVLEYRYVVDVLRIYVAQAYTGHAVDHYQRGRVVECALAAYGYGLRLVAGGIAAAVAYRKSRCQARQCIRYIGNGPVGESRRADCRN